MKFFKMQKLLIIILLEAISLPALLAQGNGDFMRETGGRAPTAQLRTGTTSPEAPEDEGTKTGGHDRNDG